VFYHYNEKLQIFANTRCGNTNMHHYFDVDVEAATRTSLEHIHFFLNSDINNNSLFPTIFSNELIVVLRNPLDRVISAINGVPKMTTLILPYRHNFEKELGREVSDKFLEDYAIFKLHCAPYLYLLKDKEFRIIDFTKLDEYIPRNTARQQSPVTNSSGYTDPKLVYVENPYFTLQDLETEYETYLALLTDREQISVAEWKEKTT
jgi:hypothetical protein